MCNRCDWAENSELEKIYHDNEWGKIDKDERYLFEMLCLEGLQAGLSWSLILQKRAEYKACFANFEYEKVAQMQDKDIEALLTTENKLIKNRNKMYAIRHNAQIFMDVQAAFGSFATYIWQFTQQQQIVNHWQDISEMPAQSELSEIISKDMKKRGFKFVGPVIIYSYLQAIGVINDHLISCDFRK